MTSTGAFSYERQLQLVGALGWPSSSTARAITWCSGKGPLGVARTPEGALEIFIAGPELAPRSPSIRDNMEHQRWFRSDGEPLMANRLLLPAASHFEQVAAFLCTELLRNGIQDDVQRAFASTEAVIELAIERLRLADRAALGLIGELLLLRSLLNAAPNERISEVVMSWHGYRETPRDIQLRDVGVEVKTTTRSTSSHLVQGVHQVEAGHGVDGGREGAFFLVSVGLRWSEQTGSTTTSLPSLVRTLIERIEAGSPTTAEAVSQMLVERIFAYGASEEIGYDHETMRDDTAFQRLVEVTFARCYDMTDPAIRLITSDDIRARPYVDPASLRFRVNLPELVSGDVNPVHGMGPAASLLLKQAGLA